MEKNPANQPASTTNPSKAAAHNNCFCKFIVKIFQLVEIFAPIVYNRCWNSISTVYASFFLLLLLRRKLIEQPNTLSITAAININELI